MRQFGPRASGGGCRGAQVGALCALGTLCLDHEDHRRQLAEARVLAQIVRALDDPDAQARPPRGLGPRAAPRAKPLYPGL